MPAGGSAAYSRPSRRDGSCALCSGHSVDCRDLLQSASSGRPPLPRKFPVSGRCAQDTRGDRRMPCTSFALTSRAARDTRRMIPLSSANLLALSSTAMCVKPVMSPPGCAKFSTSLLPIGPGTTTSTMGMVVVARCAASAAGGVTATRTSTLEPARSTAWLMNRSGCSFVNTDMCYPAALRISCLER